MQRREAKIGLRDRKGHRRPKEWNDIGENPHRNGLSGVGAGICGFVGLDGGDGRDRTANPPPSHRTGLSDIRVRNGNFRCRDGSVKTAVPPLRDRYRDAQRLERPPFWRECDGMVQTGCPHAVLSNRVSATRLDRCDVAFAPRGVRIGNSA